MKVPELMCINRTGAAAIWFATVLLLPAPRANGQAACEAKEAFQQVNGLLAQRNYAASAKTLDQLRSCPRLSPLETFEMGWLYGRARRFDVALRIFDSVPRNVPDQLTHEYAIALSKFELGDYRGTIDVLKSLQSNQVSDAKSANLLAVAYSKLSLYRQAYAVLAQELQRDPKDLATYLNLVTVCAEGGDFARAAEVASQAAALFPQSAEVMIVRGAAHALLGHTDQARRDFAAGARLAPERPDARFFLAWAAYQQANFKEAITVLKQAEGDGLRDSDLHYLMAECLLKIDSTGTDTPLRELNQAVQLNPDSVSARTLRGRLLLENGKAEEAAADLEIAGRLAPESRSAAYNLARAYRQTGRTEQAEVLFRKLRAGKPDILQETGDRRLNEALVNKGSNP